MKKAFLIALILLLIGGAFFCGAFLSNGGFDFEKEDFVTRTVSVEEDFSSVLVEIYTTDLKILPAEDGKCSVVLHEKENNPHTVAAKGGTLYVSAQKDTSLSHFLFGYKHATAEIYLPKDAYKSLSIKCATGDIYVGDAFAFSELDVEVSTGDVELYASVTGSAEIEATTGDVTVDGIRARSLEISLTTGTASVMNTTVEGEVDIETGSGAVKIDTLYAKGIEIEGSTGRRDLCNLTIQGAAIITSTTGAVSISRMQANSLNAHLTTGDLLIKDCLFENRINAEANSGDITFDASDAGEITVRVSTGDVTGTLLTGKIFDTDSNTGKITVPDNDPNGGKCKITTTTGRIEIAIAHE